MLIIDESIIKMLKKQLDDLNYGTYFYLLRDKQHFCTVWPDLNWTNRIKSEIGEKLYNAYEVFLYGKHISFEVLSQIMKKEFINELLHIGILIKDGEELYSEYSIVCYLDSYFLVGLCPEYYQKSPIKFERKDIYIGLDSLILCNNMKYLNGELLDLCSGSGIQGILAAKRSNMKVTCVEINKEACNVIEFNKIINDVSDNVKVINNDLFEGIDSKFDMIVANPPYVPIPDNLDYYVSGDGGNDGVMIINKILLNCHKYLKKYGQVWMVGEILEDNNGRILWEYELQKLKELGFKIYYKLEEKNNFEACIHEIVNYWAKGENQTEKSIELKRDMVDYYKNNYRKLYGFLLQVISG